MMTGLPIISVKLAKKFSGICSHSVSCKMAMLWHSRSEPDENLNIALVDS